MLKFAIIIIIFFIGILILLFISKTKEPYENITKKNEDDKCNDFFLNNSYCDLNIDTNTCNCKYQKDDLKYVFDSPENCCQRNCFKLSPDECIEKNNFTKIPYYCNVGGVCKKYNGTIVESHIATNNCGLDPLNNQLLLPYATYDECIKNLNPCDQYNIPSRSSHINQDKCLKDNRCGYCTNSVGGGKCIEGAPDGPANFHKYFFCNPEVRNTDKQENRYYYGDFQEFILQDDINK